VTLEMIVNARDTSVTWISPGLAARVGIDEHALVGRPVRQVLVDLPPDVDLSHNDDEPDARFFDDLVLGIVDGDAAPAAVVLQLRSIRHVDGGRQAVFSFSIPDQSVADSATRIAESAYRYATLLRDAAEGIVIHDEAHVIAANHAARRLVGWPRDAVVVDVPIATFIDVEDPDALESARRAVTEDPSEPQHLVLRLLRADGTVTVPVQAAIAAVQWEGRSAIQVIMYEISGSRARPEVATVVTDERLRIIGWDRPAQHLYGWTAAEVRGRRISDVLGSPDPRLPSDQALAAAASSRSFDTPAIHLHKDGSQIAVRTTTTVRRAGGTDAGLLVVARRTGAAQTAATPPVAVRSGRDMLLADLESEATGTRSLVAMFDVDHFHLVNTRHGSPVGDAALTAIEQRLRVAVGGSGLVVRLGGDRFGFRCTVGTPEEARDLVAQLERRLTEPIDLDGAKLAMSFSTGASWGPNDPCLYEQAESGLREARSEGGRRVCWFEVDRRRTDPREDESLVADLLAGLSSGAVYVAYQEIVDLSTRRTLKVEALARWNHPDRGPIPPGVFIPLAERHGVIDALGTWVLERACHDVVEMHRRGVDVDLTVNLSVIQLRDPDITQRVERAIRSAGLAADRVWIEVTESVLVDDRAIAPLHRLHDLGVRLVIDDFGTGYSTFQYLTRLPVDALKIDMTFVAGLGVDVSDTAIVRSVIGLGRELGLQVVAEGVETESQRAQLLRLDCRLGQGWLFGPAVALETFLGAQQRASQLHTSAPATTSVTEEPLRLNALRACKVLDTNRETAFDSLVQLAARLLRTPMALISLIETDRQWFKARVGVDVSETPRDVSFCAHAIEQPREPFVIADALVDDRFAANPLVTGPPNIRAYAGIPICSREGLALGALGVMDTEPRTFTSDEVAMLTTLADQASTLLDLRRRAAELHALILRLQALHLGDDPPEHPQTGSITPIGDVLTELRRTSPRREPSGTGSTDTLRFGPLVIDLATRACVNNGAPVALEAEQFDLVAFLTARPGHVFSARELGRRLWPAGHEPTALDRLVREVRDLIEPDPFRPQLLYSVGTNGYRLGAPSDDGRTTDRDALEPRVGSWTHIHGRVVAADEGMGSMLCTSVDELVGRDVFEFVAPASRAATSARLEMHATGHTPGPQLITMQAADGHQLTTLVGSAPSEFGQRPAITVTFEEVLDPPQLLRRLVSEVLNEVSDAVIVTDAELQVISWNRAAQRLYGWSEQDVIGHSFHDVVRPSTGFDRHSARAELDRTGRWVRETSQLTRDGVTVWVRASVNLIRDEAGEISGIVAVNRPIDAPSTRTGAAAG
jgi:PAS domain S-box-containing protein/diguanylate cyclase (GGDEF)-like protein